MTWALHSLGMGTAYFDEMGTAYFDEFALHSLTNWRCVGSIFKHAKTLKGFDGWRAPSAYFAQFQNWRSVDE
jgi:hypothetical protein